MKKVIFSLAVLSLVFVTTSCNKDDDGGSNDNNSCQTCAAFDIEVNGMTQTNPAQEVCEGENGNAFVNGIDTMQTFSDYIAALELFTTCQ